MLDVDGMALALAWSERALGRTAPNPSVGAVLVRDGVVLGAGATLPAGQDHAEVQALKACRAAGLDPAGATIYVTLEPCCHVGRTPPCTLALLEAGVSRVVVGAVDPDPRVQGQGIAQLRAAGVAVELGVLGDQSERRILGFSRALCGGFPELTLKLATSADGKLATANGESQWITGSEAREAGHRLRGQHDAVMVGAGTALADNPRLNVRLPVGDPWADRAPVAVVLDSALRLPQTLAMFHGVRPAVVICAVDAPVMAHPAALVRVSRGADGRLDLRAALVALAARGLHRVLVEGGAQLAGSLVQAGLVDRLEQFVAGRLLPGGLPAVGGPAVLSLAEAPRFTLAGLSQVGEDAWLRWDAAPAGASEGA